MCSFLFPLFLILVSSLFLFFNLHLLRKVQLNEENLFHKELQVFFFFFFKTVNTIQTPFLLIPMPSHISFESRKALKARY